MRGSLTVKAVPHLSPKPFEGEGLYFDDGLQGAENKVGRNNHTSQCKHSKGMSLTSTVKMTVQTSLSPSCSSVQEDGSPSYFSPMTATEKIITAIITWSRRQHHEVKGVAYRVCNRDQCTGDVYFIGILHRV